MGALEHANGGEHEIQRPVDERLHALSDAVDRLGETDRELLRLIAWDGLTAREASIALGISHAAARVRLHRLRRRLAREIGLPGESRTTISSVGRLDARKGMR